MEWKLENLLGYFTMHSFLFVWGNDLVKQGNSVHLAADSWYFSSHLAHWPTLLNSSYFKYTCSCSFLYLLTTQSIYFCLIPCPMASVRKSIKKFPPTQQLRMSDCQNSCILEQYPGQLQLDLVTYPVCICILLCVLNSPPNMGTHDHVISIQSLHHCQCLCWLLLCCFQQCPHITILYTTLKYYNMTFLLSQSLGQLDLVLLCWHISLCDR